MFFILICADIKESYGSVYIYYVFKEQIDQAQESRNNETYAHRIEG